MILQQLSPTMYFPFFLSASLISLRSVSSYPLPTIKRVVVVGGTHGNEYTGVWCMKAIEKHPEKFKINYPSLEISTLLANPQAHLENKRFIHTDLNREFSDQKLLLMDNEGLPNTIESLRAQEVNEILGPKFGSDEYETDLVIDLHSTTSNMGLTVIIPEGDAVMAQAAAHVVHECGGVRNDARCLMHTIPKKKHRPNLSSASKHGFTIEVGPVPQGVVRHDMVEMTDLALHSLLDFLEKRNKGEDVMGALKRAYPSSKVPCFRSAPAKLPGEMSGKITWPSDPENPNFPALMIHKSLQDRDFHTIRKGDPLFVAMDGSVIPYAGSHGDEVYLMFVNEAGYYYQSSGTGIGVAVASKFDLIDGMMEEKEEFACIGGSTMKS